MPKLDPNVQHHPVVVKQVEKRASDVQLKVADAITTFAGSMMFVYLHAAIFGVWCATGLFGADKFPFNFLTMAVSLEAIFLSTFVMISQNRADARRQVLADHQWQLVQDEERQNEDLLAISRQLLDLTREVHALTSEIHGIMKRVE